MWIVEAEELVEEDDPRDSADADGDAVSWRVIWNR